MNNPPNYPIPQRAALSLGFAAWQRSAIRIVLTACLPLAAGAAGLDPLMFSSSGTFNPGGNATVTANGSVAPTLTVAGGTTYTGVYFSQGSGLPVIAVFDFASINLASGITLGGSTSVPVAFLSRGSLTIAGTIHAAGFGGGAGGTGAADSFSNGAAGGGLGGGAGGLGGNSVGNGGDGGSYGGSGFGNPGNVYGKLATALQAGSGGGGSSGSQFGAVGNNGGAGGGGLELGATGALTLASSAVLSAPGTPGVSATSSPPGGAGGGSGSGGGVFLHGNTLSLAGAVNADGGSGSSGFPGEGRAGGGGRVLLTESAFIVGTSPVPTTAVNVAGGLQDSSGQRGGSGTADLAPDVTTVPTGQTLTVTGGKLAGTVLAFSSNLTTVQSGGTFANSGGYTNQTGAEFSLTASDARITGDTFTNAGLLDGPAGRVEAAVANSASGEIRAASASNLVFTATGNTNAGSINLLGGMADFQQGLSNTGSIAGHGSLAAGGTGLNNSGTVSFSQSTDVLGTVHNTGAGKLIATGGATVTYFGAVTHNGAEIRTAVGSRTTFLGAVNGAGNFTDTGTVDFEGGYSPGNSPAAVSLAGDAVFGAGNQLTIEIAGVTRGTGFDALLVTGHLTLGGALNVTLLNGFTPAKGQQFDLFDWGTQTGTFSSVNLPALANGMSWDTTKLYTNGSVDVVPEPSTWAMLVLGISLLTLRRAKGARYLE